MISEKKILLGLTTTGKSDWRDKVSEINELNIEEISLIPTGLNIIQRKSLYELLDKSSLKEIPHVHLRDDMEEWELDYFFNKYKTKVFNCHTDERGLAFLNKNFKYKQMIFLENSSSGFDYVKIFNKEELDKIKPAGVCLDLSHLELDRLNKKSRYKKSLEVFQNYFIGCNHVSGVKSNWSDKFFGKSNDSHYLESLTELNYLLEVDKKFFSHYITIEVENSFLEQLEIKKYIEEVIT